MICTDNMKSLLLFPQPFHILRLPPACSATSRHFQLSPHYEYHVITMHVSLDRANINTINISMTNLCIWQVLIATVPQDLITQLSKHMISHSKPILPFEITEM